MPNKKPFTEATIFELAKKGIFLYQPSEGHILFKVDMSMTTQQSHIDDKRLQTRINENLYIIKRCIHNVKHDLKNKLSDPDPKLNKFEWAIAVLWKLIDFSGLENYLINHGIVNRERLKSMTLVDSDFQAIANNLLMLDDLFPDTLQHFMLYVESHLD